MIYCKLQKQPFKLIWIFILESVSAVIEYLIFKERSDYLKYIISYFISTGEVWSGMVEVGVP